MGIRRKKMSKLQKVQTPEEILKEVYYLGQVAHLQKDYDKSIEKVINSALDQLTKYYKCPKCGKEQ